MSPTPRVPAPHHGAPVARFEGLMPPAITVIIPTRERPALVGQSVASALSQDVDVEVVVVDDGSDDRVQLGRDPRVHVHWQPPAGGAAARNTGLALASAPVVTYLDDDDELAPGALPRALDALATHDEAAAAPPTAVLSAVAEVTADGRVLAVRQPPTLPAGTPFPLVSLPVGTSHGVKQSLVIHAEVLRDLGGWNPRFRSRVHTELFMRLGVVCALHGLDHVGYRLTVHDGPRVSRDPRLRQRSWRQLRRTHHELLARHPRGAAALALTHARSSWGEGHRGAALAAVLDAAGHSPGHVLAGIGRTIRASHGARADRGSA